MKIRVNRGKADFQSENSLARAGTRKSLVPPSILCGAIATCRCGSQDLHATLLIVSCGLFGAEV